MSRKDSQSRLVVFFEESFKQGPSESHMVKQGTNKVSNLNLSLEVVEFWRSGLIPLGWMEKG